MIETHIVCIFTGISGMFLPDFIYLICHVTFVSLINKSVNQQID
jgi:hypothetical protein